MLRERAASCCGLVACSYACVKAIAIRKVASRLQFCLFGALISCLLIFTVLAGQLGTRVALRDDIRNRALAECAPSADISIKPTSRVAIIIPFVPGDIPRIISGLHDWVTLGNACSASTTGRAALFFYASGSPPQPGDVQTEALDVRFHTIPGIKSQVVDCFSEVTTIYAQLSAAEDGYPEGPSNMFFKLFCSDHLDAYTHMFWMEWDVRPVRPLWVDALVDAAASRRFWMMGGMYVGYAFDATVMYRDNWPWVGHLNGNALYALHDEEFQRYIALVQEREPPGHFWKPFDISLWKVIYTWPYSWHLYQTYAAKFVLAPFVRHLGFTTSAAEEAKLMQDPTVFLLHGRNSSAGTYKYERKFVQGRPVSNSTILWADEIPPELRISVFMRTFQDDLPFAALAMVSARRYIPNALEFVAVVPVDTLANATKVMPSFVRVIGEDVPPPLLKDGQLAQKYTKLMADMHCTGRYIFHLDSDVLLSRPVLRRDLFLFNKPMLAYDRYSNLVSAHGEHALDRWRLGTAYAVGVPSLVEFEFSRANNHLYPRELYYAARWHLEHHHNKTLVDFFATRNGRYEAGVTRLRTLFSDFNYLGAFMYVHRPQLMSWQYLGTDNNPGAHAESFAYTVLVPPFVCQGNARWYVNPPRPELSARQLELFKAVAQGAPCEALQGFLSENEEWRLPPVNGTDVYVPDPDVV